MERVWWQPRLLVPRPASLPDTRWSERRMVAEGLPSTCCAEALRFGTQVLGCVITSDWPLTPPPMGRFHSYAHQRSEVGAHARADVRADVRTDVRADVRAMSGQMSG